MRSQRHELDEMNSAENQASFFTNISQSVGVWDLTGRDKRPKINIRDARACILGYGRTLRIRCAYETTAREECERTRGREIRSARNARNATGPSMISSRIPSGYGAPCFSRSAVTRHSVPSRRRSSARRSPNNAARCTRNLWLSDRRRSCWIANASSKLHNFLFTWQQKKKRETDICDF